MTMDLQQRIKAFELLGHTLTHLLQNNLKPAKPTPAIAALTDQIRESAHYNPWFTPDNVESALKGIANMLHANSLSLWAGNYNNRIKANPAPKTIGVVLAGNLPVVGFHDMLCVLMAGHRFLGKLSGQDQHLPVKLADLLCEIEPEFIPYIEFTRNPLSGFDAIIATGSNNTSRYFEYYFGKYPHIIRKNRNSIAVLSGQETQHELSGLCHDIFAYFGMGCRSVSALLVPDGWDPLPLLHAMQSWQHLRDHHKYYNNYEYQKAIMLVNNEPHFDTGFLLVRKQHSLISPLAVLNYFSYKHPEEIPGFLFSEKDNIQCVATVMPLVVKGVQLVKPGQTQNPALTDYADGVDTLSFLLDL